MEKCDGFQKQIPPYIAYWTTILAELNKHLPPTPTNLVEGFWPSHDWNAILPEPLPVMKGGDFTPEDDKSELYCGPQNERPKDALNPWRDVVSGSWVLLRPSDPEIYPVWLERAHSAVNRIVGHEHNGMFIIKFWA